MKKLVLALTLLVASCAPAHAVDGEISLGWTKFGHQPDGIWYQSNLPHKLNMQSPSISIGLTGRVNDWMAWHAGYIYLGKATSTAEATASDQDYAERACGGKPCWPLSHWEGEGSVQGLYATVTPEWKRGNYTLYAEAGLTLTNNSWTMTIRDWRPCADCAPGYLRLDRAFHPQIGGIVGLGIKRGGYSLGLRAITADASGSPKPCRYSGEYAAFGDGNCQAIYHGTAWNVAFGHEF